MGLNQEIVQDLMIFIHTILTLLELQTMQMIPNLQVFLDKICIFGPKCERRRGKSKMRERIENLLLASSLTAL